MDKEKDKKEKNDNVEIVERVTSNLPVANQSRIESFLGYIAGQEEAVLPVPQSRV